MKKLKRSNIAKASQRHALVISLDVGCLLAVLRHIWGVLATK